MPFFNGHSSPTIELTRRETTALRSNPRAEIVLHPTDAANPRGAKIMMPDDLEDGDYDVEVMNPGDRASTMLPIKLRLGKASPPRKVK